MPEKQRTVPAPNLKVHFMISSTQHLNIYSSLNIYHSTTNAQRIYSICSEVGWRVVTHSDHVQVSPAYLCQCMCGTHQHFAVCGDTPHTELRTLQTRPTVQNNSLPTALCAHPVEKAPLSFHQHQITRVTNWHHCIGADVSLQLHFLLHACLPFIVFS